MTLMEIITAVNGQVTGQCDVDWQSWPGPLGLVELGNDDTVWAHATFCRKDQRVYAVELELEPGVITRWLDPEYADAWVQECHARGLAANTAQIVGPNNILTLLNTLSQTNDPT